MPDAINAAILEKMEADPAFAAALDTADSAEAAMAVLSEAGFNVQPGKVKARELTDKELESVAGGRLAPWVIYP